MENEKLIVTARKNPIFPSMGLCDPHGVVFGDTLYLFTDRDAEIHVLFAADDSMAPCRLEVRCADPEGELLAEWNVPRTRGYDRGGYGMLSARLPAHGETEDFCFVVRGAGDGQTEVADAGNAPGVPVRQQRTHRRVRGVRAPSEAGKGRGERS